MAREFPLEKTRNIGTIAHIDADHAYGGLRFIWRQNGA